MIYNLKETAKQLQQIILTWIQRSDTLVAVVLQSTKTNILEKTRFVTLYFFWWYFSLEFLHFWLHKFKYLPQKYFRFLLISIWSLNNRLKFFIQQWWLFLYCRNIVRSKTSVIEWLIDTNNETNKTKIKPK